MAKQTGSNGNKNKAGLTMNNDRVNNRIHELFEPIDRQVMMTDNTEDLLMLASAMLCSCKNIFSVTLGPKGAVKMFESIIDDVKKGLS